MVSLPQKEISARALGFGRGERHHTSAAFPSANPRWHNPKPQKWRQFSKKRSARQHDPPATSRKPRKIAWRAAARRRFLPSQSAKTRSRRDKPRLARSKPILFGPLRASCHPQRLIPSASNQLSVPSAFLRARRLPRHSRGAKSLRRETSESPTTALSCPKDLQRRAS